MEKWEEIARIDPKRCPGGRVRTRSVSRPDGGSYTVVEVYMRNEEDVTAECTAELKQSHHTQGYYCNILHNGRSILALGIDDASKCQLRQHYRIEKAEGATVSFKILKNS